MRTMLSRGTCVKTNLLLAWFALASVSGCIRVATGGYAVEFEPLCADTGRMPIEWALEISVYASNPQGPALEPPAKQPPLQFELSGYEMWLQKPESRTVDLPQLVLAEGFVLAPMSGYGRTRNASVHLYAMGYERASSGRPLFYDRDRMRMAHRRMKDEMAKAPADEMAPLRWEEQRILEHEAELLKPENQWRRASILKRIDELRARLPGHRRTQREAIQDQFVEMYGPLVLDPEYPEKVAVQLVPWDVSTEEFKRFWRSMSTPSEFEPMLALLASWSQCQRSDRQKAAARRIAEWYVARYDAAVRQDPGLAADEQVARRVSEIRELFVGKSSQARDRQIPQCP